MNKKRPALTPATLLLLQPICIGSALAAEQKDSDTLVVMAQPTGLTELGSPVSVSVIDGETLCNAAPQINLSENLGSVPGLQIQNRQNYAQDLQMSIRGFGSRSMFGVRGVQYRHQFRRTHRGAARPLFRAVRQRLGRGYQC